MAMNISLVKHLYNFIPIGLPNLQNGTAGRTGFVKDVIFALFLPQKYLKMKINENENVYYTQ